jgi:hypothetical protein
VVASVVARAVEHAVLRLIGTQRTVRVAINKTVIGRRGISI